ncbi:hypothetical protein M758_5G001500 [Ceratodon purpureus]|nr:hypothetical protein M758_5G001500 [Ceratodon purpureus]
MSFSANSLPDAEANACIPPSAYREQKSAAAAAFNKSQSMAETSWAHASASQALMSCSATATTPSLTVLSHHFNE